MQKKIFGILFHPRLMAIAMICFATAMAVATFIENDYGPATSKALVYNTKWFELILFLLTVNFTGNIFKYRLYRKQKWPVLLFHLAFIIILVGSFITRYFGFEGTVPIREGSQTSTIYSDQTYINISVDDDKFMKSYENKVLFGQIGQNKYHLRDIFGKNEDSKIPFSITLKDFTPRAKEIFEINENGINTLHLVKASGGARKNIYLAEGETKTIDHTTFSFNNYVKGGINFFQEQKELSLQTPVDGNYMEMSTGNTTPIAKNSIAPLHLRHLYSFGDLKFVAAQLEKGKKIKRTAPKEEQEMYPHDALTLKIRSGEESKIVEIKGAKGVVMRPEIISLNGLNFAINYGSKQIEMPFSLKLRDFQMERYPGTNSASSYASEVTLIDTDKKAFDYRIFMNHVLDYKGYRFFQASYDKDEQGTILSVNHDYWGTLITYLGYSLMGIGMFCTLFLKGSRFSTLSQELKKTAHKKTAVVLLLLATIAPAWAQNTNEIQQHAVSKKHADAFGKLLIQDQQGRIKPIHTYALEALRKVYKKDTYKGLSAGQVLLSVQLNPKIWSRQRIIKVKTDVLGKKITDDLKVKNATATLVDCFTDGNYYLRDKVTQALVREKTMRTATDQETIDLDERINVWWNVLNGSLLRIYPKENDSNNTWYTGIDENVFVQRDTMVRQMHQLYMVSLQSALQTGDYSEPDEYLALIAQYQRKLAKDIIPPPEKIDLEIIYNRWDIFKKLLFYYMLVGLVLLVLTFVNLLKPTSQSARIGLKIAGFFTVLGTVAHALGLAMRWYISGHEPWSNGYEAVVFVAFVTVLAGLIFSHNRSKFTLASTVLFSSFLLGIAQGSMMNPEITNLVPVLKSYWLMIHVAVITASYGFLGLGALLGLTVLLLYIVRTPGNAQKLNKTIKELTCTNENTLTVGLFALAIGTFLGGVWANESWGRYWGWDPKEVWALISVIVYVFVLHMRLVPGLRGQFAFNAASLFAISTLIMTFFGVNYYLSGMHSYAGGDPVPIPVWIYPAIAFFVLLAALAYFKYRKFTKLT